MITGHARINRAAEFLTNKIVPFLPQIEHAAFALSLHADKQPDHGQIKSWAEGNHFFGVPPERKPISALLDTDVRPSSRRSGAGTYS
jgi:hypothetical protein